MTARIWPPTPANLRHATARLRDGQVIGIPTETVYGLAGNALDPTALARIFAAKQRPTFDPLIVHVCLDLSRPRLPQLVALQLVDATLLSDLAIIRIENLLLHYWPGPLTLVLPKSPRVPDLATAGLSTVAVRMPAHDVALKLLSECGFPLAAPSANRFGHISPTCAADVVAELGEQIEGVLDGGPCEIGVESTVLAVDPTGRVHLLRPGGTPLDVIETLLQIKISPTATAPNDILPQSPGQLTNHYAPHKPMILLPDLIENLTVDRLKSLLPERQGLGLLRLQPGPTWPLSDTLIAEEVLAAAGDFPRAAQRLFACLRALDASHAQLLVAEPCLAIDGLGYAIGDRLRRAAVK